MSRLVRPDELLAATEYVIGTSAHHTPSLRTGGRRYLAKCVYWAALGESGYSMNEVAQITGANKSTIWHAMEHDVPKHLVDAVISRANSQVRA